jgi:hypothetical protein
MRIIITENQKNKLFIPRKLTGENSRWSDWNNKQPIIDGVQINQYDLAGNKQGYWDEYHYDGGLHTKGNYKNNEMSGIWGFYNPDGKIYLKRLFKGGRLVKELPLTESEQPKKKLFIPRKIDEREVEAEKIKKHYINDIKSIIKKEGPISYDDLSDDSPTYEPENRYTTIAFFTRYELERVEITIYNAVTGKEMDSYFINYEELDLKELFEIKEVLKSR